MAKPNNWEDARKELTVELGREPKSDEIQNRMLQCDLDDNNKIGDIKMKIIRTAKYKDKLKGGKGDTKAPSDFPKKDIEKGHRVEFEHTNDPDTAKEIAIDHLEEHPDYYVGLKHMEETLTEIEERAKKKK